MKRPKKGEALFPKKQSRIEKQKSMTLEEMLSDLPVVCDRGTKINSKEYKESWNGYKLHLDAADGEIPNNERTTVERVFSRLKDEFGGQMVRVRGATKVMAHLMSKNTVSFIK